MCGHKHEIKFEIFGINNRARSEQIYEVFFREGGTSNAGKLILMPMAK